MVFTQARSAQIETIPLVNCDSLPGYTVNSNYGSKNNNSFHLHCTVKSISSLTVWTFGVFGLKQCLIVQYKVCYIQPPIIIL